MPWDVRQILGVRCNAIEDCNETSRSSGSMVPRPRPRAAPMAGPPGVVAFGSRMIHAVVSAIDDLGGAATVGYADGVSDGCAGRRVWPVRVCVPSRSDLERFFVLDSV